MARQPPSREQLAEDPTVFRKLAACELEVEVPGRSIDKHRTYWKRVASHLDTCAEVDCISPSFVRALNIPTEPATGVLKGVGNISSNVAEVVQLNVRVPGKKQAVWRHIVFAVTEVPGHILFSNPTLTRMGATISLAEGEVCLGGHKIPLIRTDEWPTNKVMATKALLKTVKQVLGGQDHVKEFRRLESMVDIGPAEANQRLQQLLEQYKDVFKDNGQPAKLPPLHLPDFMKEEHKGRVINIPPRQWSSKEEAILDEQVEQFLEAGIVAPCNSKWNTRQVLVKKANGSWRPCMDFTALNKLLKDYSYPLPKISDIMATIGRSKPRFFSTLDLMKAFMQWGLTEESQEMTAFTTKKGKYCFTRLPFGLKVASEVYQEGMAAAFGDALLYIALLIFIDDLLVFTKTRRGHLFVLEKVFEVSRALNLKLSQEKCLFLQEEVTYVGRRINAKGEEPAQAHLDAIREIPVPTNKSELRSFLAAAQYTIKPYAPTFSRLAADLWKMTSLDQKIKFKWKEEHQQKFQAIKDLCVQQLRKNHFDDDKPVELYTDGSKQGVAGVLVQEDKVVAIVSRVLKASEKNYHPVEFEMLAVAYAMNSFAHYLRGRHFTLYTDHKPLLGVLRKLDVENSRLQNLKLKVSEFSFTAKHVKGVDNKADYWTRLFGESPEDGVDEEKENEETEETESRVHVVVRSFDGKYSDADMETILKMDHRKTACGYEVKQGDSWRLYVPEDARTSLLWETHRDRHQGVTYMEKELRRYYWPAMRSSVQVFVEACKCAAAKEVKPRDLVMRHVPRRSRQKQEPVYRGPMKVLEATTDRSYRVQGADNRVHRVHVDDIKRYSLPNANNLQVNPTVLAESMEECKFADVTPPQQLAYALEEDWADKQVYLGVIFSDLELKCVLDKVKATKGAQVLMVIPELRFYDSYKWMEQGQDLSVYWIGLPQEEDVLLTADDQPAGSSMSGNNSSVYEECAEVLVDLYDRKYRRKTRAASEEEERMLQEVKADFLAWPVMKRPARLLVEALEARDVQRDEVPEMLRVILLGTDGLSSDAEQKSDDQESKILHSWIEMITSYVEGKVSHVRPSASLDRDPDVENSGNSTVMGTPRSHESQRDVLSRPTTVSRDDVKTNQAAPFHLAKFHLNFTTYAGAKNKCAQWWETFQEEASLHRVDDRAMILLMKNQLKGKALNYFVELKERLREQTKFVTADALAKGLINHFDYRRLEHLQMEWRMLAQKEGETFADFELRCRRTVRDLKSLGDTVIDLADDEAYLEAVWQRCNRDKYRMLKCTSKCKSVDELAAVIKEVLQEDAKGPASTTTVEGSVNVTTQGKRVVKCFRCQEEGHIRRNCPKRKKKGGRDLSKAGPPRKVTEGVMRDSGVVPLCPKIAGDGGGRVCLDSDVPHQYPGLDYVADGVMVDVNDDCLAWMDLHAKQAQIEYREDHVLAYPEATVCL
eukprot:g14964.t1